MNVMLESICRDVELRDALEYAFDFCVSHGDDSPPWFHILAPEQFEPVAKDGSEGVFLIGESSGRVLFVSSEGQAGIVARTIDELLELMVSQPFWRDLLKFSGNGQLLEMRRAAPYLQREFDEAPELGELRELVARKLGISFNASAIERLHDRVADGSTNLRIEAPDGTALIGLFNDFTVDDNPSWCAADAGC